MDINRDSGLPKYRKRNPNRSDDAEDAEDAIPINALYKPRMERQNQIDESDTPVPDCVNNARCYFCDFCDNTSIHGFKFLGERQRYIVEKLWWFMVVACALSGSGILIYNTYIKWAKAPVIVTFATTETAISQIPFPAVTICPELKVDKKQLNYSNILSRIIYEKEVNETENQLFSFFAMICDDLGVDVTMLNFTPSKEPVDVLDFLVTYVDVFAETNVRDCKWLGNMRNCNELLSPTYTSEGMCLTFNKLDEWLLYVEPEEYYKNSSGTEDRSIRKWSLEEGYPPNAGLDTYPLRTIIAGSNAGFHIVLGAKDDDMDYGCGELQGFKVALHHPLEEPDMDKHFRVPLDEAVYVAVKPRMMTTADEIGHYPPGKRHCYLPGEKVLETFNNYTQQNCMTECLTNYTKSVCGCVEYYRAVLGENEICTLKDKHCVDNARVVFLEGDQRFAPDTENTDEITKQCNCLPSCTSIEFEAETSQNKYDWENVFRALHPESEVVQVVEGHHYSKLVVYYKDMQFMTSERHELYGTIDFLANCGGLLGLFCGFSFTSSMEILYYLTLRLVCNLRKFGRRVWSGAPELM